MACTNPLDNIKIASPCAQDWDSMVGSGRKRYCGDCKLNVYNLSGMTRDEAERLIMNSEGRLCVRFYRRADGTILTSDCPVGWRALKKKISKTAAAFASMLFGLVGGIGFFSYFEAEKEPYILGTMEAKSSNFEPEQSRNANLSIMMGNFMPEEMDETEQISMGKIAVNSSDKRPLK